MRRTFYQLFAAFALMVAVPAVDHSMVAVALPTPVTNAITHQREMASFANLPIRFEPNVGQAPQSVEYSARGSGYFVALTRQGAVLGLPGAAARQDRARSPAGATPSADDAARLRLRPMHANATPRLLPERRQNSVSNYFVGTDISKWRRNVANYAAVRYEQIYPGIDWVVYGNPQQLEYDFVVAPGADPQRIRLQVEGAQSLSVDENGDLLVRVQERTLRQLRPVIYQTAEDGGRRAIQGRYIVSKGAFSFALGDYDRSRALIIDPAFVYSTYFSASALAIATDGQGSAYIAGTTSTGLPTKMPLQSGDLERNFPTAFISKFNAAGTELVYSTYLGGSGNDRTGNLGYCGPAGSGNFGRGAVITGNGGDGATALAVDAAGNAYLAGFTSSSDFPTVSPLQATNHAAVNHGSNAFLAKLNATGDALVYSTYLGGSGVPGALVTGDMAAAIAVDGAGNAYVAGITMSTDFPTMAPFQAGNRESTTRPTGFVAKLNAAGSALLYSSYLGGSGESGGSGIGDCANAIAVDGSGNAYVAGQTSSTDFPVAGAFQPSNRSPAAGTGFLAKLDTSGSNLVYSTYLGGSSNDSALAVAVDTLGDAYVAGYTFSPDFPVANALQARSATASGAATAFVTKFNPAGSGLVYSTYLGGSTDDQANALAVDAAGNAYVAGYTYSADFPVVDAVQSANNAAGRGANNAFVSVLDPTGHALNFSTYLGGSGKAVEHPCPVGSSSCPPFYMGDSAAAIAVDAAGDIYVTGTTYSADFPTVSAFQTQPAATFVTKIAPGSTLSKESNTTSAGLTSPSGTSGGGGALGWDVISLLGLAVAVRLLQRHARYSPR